MVEKRFDNLASWNQKECIFNIFNSKLSCSLQGHPVISQRNTSCKKQCRWQQALDDSILGLDRTQNVFEKIDEDPCLSYSLPRKNSLAGGVLKHCFTIVDGILDKYYPLIYKFGYCSDAHSRFYNKKYGYHLSCDKWEHMKILYASAEPVSPGFVEGALIQKHKGYFPLVSVRFLKATFVCINIFKSNMYMCSVLFWQQCDSVIHIYVILMYIYIHDFYHIICPNCSTNIDYQKSLQAHFPLLRKLRVPQRERWWWDHWWVTGGALHGVHRI